MPQVPVAVFGALRSGSTLFRLMLDANTRLSCPGESDFLLDFLHRRDQTWRYDREGLSANRIFRASGLAIASELDGLGAFFDMVEKISSEAGGNIPILMLHRGLGKLIEIVPDAKVIHLVRDPRDVARSSVGMGWAGNVYHGCSHWIATETEWQKSATQLKHPPLEVRFEELIAAPEQELTRVCDYLGVAYEARMLAFDESTTYERPDPSLAVQWKKKMTQQEVRLVEARIGPLLEISGYEASGYPPLSPSRLHRAFLSADSRSRAFVHAARKYGLRLAVASRLASRVGSSSFRSKTQREIDEIDIRHLK